MTQICTRKFHHQQWLSQIWRGILRVIIRPWQHDQFAREGAISEHHDHLRVQCIIPKFAKQIIDGADEELGKHYQLTPEEIDFTINYDIKYRFGADGDEDD